MIKKRHTFILLGAVLTVVAFIFVDLLTVEQSLEMQKTSANEHDLLIEKQVPIHLDKEEKAPPVLLEPSPSKEQSAYALWSKADLSDEDEAELQRFYKVDSDGNILPDTASEWQCVYNDLTGLLWEVKQSDGGWQDFEHTYSWYQPNTEEMEQLALGSTVTDFPYVAERGRADEGSCYVINCDTYHYALAFNEENVCAASDWRLPSAHELGYLDHDSQYNPDIDINYFPNTAIDRYWSKTETPKISSLAWSVDFKNGIPYVNEKRLSYRIRLVADAPYLREQITP